MEAVELPSAAVELQGAVVEAVELPSAVVEAVELPSAVEEAVELPSAVEEVVELQGVVMEEADGAAGLLMECDEEETLVWPPSPRRHEEEEEEDNDDEAMATAIVLGDEESDPQPVKVVPVPVHPDGGCSPPTLNPPTLNPPLQSPGVPLSFKVNGRFVCLLPGGGAAELKLVSHPGGSASGFTTVQIHGHNATATTPVITGVVSGEAAQKVLSVHGVSSESVVSLQTSPRAPKTPKPTAPHTAPLGPVSPPDCSVCSSQYKLIKQLRGFMCLCSPAIARSLKILRKKKKKKRFRRTRDKQKKSRSPRDPQTSRKGSSPRPGPSASSVTSPVQSRPPDYFLPDRPSSPPSPPEPDRPPSPPLHGKLVILVEDFYYGSAPGHAVAMAPDRRYTGPFRCINCPKSLSNNIKLMSHMKQHVSWSPGGDVSVCPHCYRHFLSAFKLQCHLEAVHSQYQSTARCRICELAFGSEAAFLWHMKTTHKPGEMPYACQVCGFRSSFYSDVWSHFQRLHGDSKQLMCPYCLRVMRSSASYQQHFARHQKKHVFGCEKCRLQFLCVRERFEHKLDHRTHIRPPQLLGLKPGTKVTVRTYSVVQGTENKEKLKRSVAPCKVEDAEPSPPATAQEAPRRKPVTSLGGLLSAISQESVSRPSPLCVECLSPFENFSSHFPSLVHCSLCGFVTCCATSYANHMINNHATCRKKIPPYRSIFHTNPRLSQTLRCVSCTFTTCRGDAMARHLTEKPEHHCIVLTHNKLGVNEPETQNAQPLHNSRSVTSSGGGAFIPIHLVPSIQTSTQLSVKPLPSPSPLPPRPAMTIRFLGPRPQTDKRPPSPLTSSQLSVVLSSLCHGVPEACRVHRTTPPTVRWLTLQQRRQLRDRKWCWRSEKLAEWVLGQREQQLRLREDALLQTARTALGDGAQPADCYSWTVDFLLRHQLALRPPPRGQRRGRLPRRLRDNCRVFVHSLASQIQSRRVPPRCVGSMDEFSVFIDPVRFSEQDPSALRLWGSPGDEPALDVVLSALADGTLLPPLLLFRGAARPPHGFPDNVLLQARPEGFNDSERLDIWIDQVWRPHVVSQCKGECVLLLDVHRGHVTEDFRSRLSSVATGVAFIPPGCCCRLQPLNICLTPVLQDFLQARWTQLVSDGGLDGLGLDQLALTLACWFSEVSSTLNSETHILRRSFSLVCSEQPVDDGGEAARMMAALSAALLQPPDASNAQQEAEPQLELLLVMEEEGVEEVVVGMEEEEEEEEALHRGFDGTAKTGRFSAS